MRVWVRASVSVSVLVCYGMVFKYIRDLSCVRDTHHLQCLITTHTLHSQTMFVFRIRNVYHQRHAFYHIGIAIKLNWTELNQTIRKWSNGKVAVAILERLLWTFIASKPFIFVLQIIFWLTATYHFSWKDLKKLSMFINKSRFIFIGLLLNYFVFFWLFVCLFAGCFFCSHRWIGCEESHFLTKLALLAKWMFNLNETYPWHFLTHSFTRHFQFTD